MLEARRRAYLHAMGIMQYAPVAAIAGAKPSPILEPEQIYPELLDVEEVVDDVVAVPPAVESAVPPSVVAPPNVEHAVEQAVANTSPTRPPSAELLPISDEPPETPDIKITPLEDHGAKDVANAPAESPVVAESVRFALTMVEVPGQIMVLADLGSADAMGCSAVEYQLLQGLLKSIGVSAEPSPHLFRWPLINNPNLVQGKMEAAEGLQGFLMAKLEKLQISRLLLIGEYASGFMPEGAAMSDVPFSGKPVQCFRIPSMGAMQSDWRYKPEAWKVLSPLSHALR